MNHAVSTWASPTIRRASLATGESSGMLAACSRVARGEYARHVPTERDVVSCKSAHGLHTYLLYD